MSTQWQPKSQRIEREPCLSASVRSRVRKTQKRGPAIVGHVIVPVRLPGIDVRDLAEDAQRVLVCTTYALNPGSRTLV